MPSFKICCTRCFVTVYLWLQQATAQEIRVWRQPPVSTVKLIKLCDARFAFVLNRNCRLVRAAECSLRNCYSSYIENEIMKYGYPHLFTVKNIQWVKQGAQSHKLLVRMGTESSLWGRMAAHHVQLYTLLSWRHVRFQEELHST